MTDSTQILKDAIAVCDISDGPASAENWNNHAKASEQKCINALASHRPALEYADKTGHSESCMQLNKDCDVYICCSQTCGYDAFIAALKEQG